MFWVPVFAGPALVCAEVMPEKSIATMIRLFIYDLANSGFATIQPSLSRFTEPLGNQITDLQTPGRQYAAEGKTD
jgi:hypothetical protein